MTATAHTPAPWIVDHGPAASLVFHANGIACVATIHHGVGAFTDGRETRANADLIAAAPDLLAALEYAMLLIKESPGANELYRAAAERKARAAIAKARGEG